MRDEKSQHSVRTKRDWPPVGWRPWEQTVQCDQSQGMPTLHANVRKTDKHPTHSPAQEAKASTRNAVLIHPCINLQSCAHPFVQRMGKGRWHLVLEFKGETSNGN